MDIEKLAIISLVTFLIGYFGNSIFAKFKTKKNNVEPLQHYPSFYLRAMVAVNKYKIEELEKKQKEYDPEFWKPGGFRPITKDQLKLIIAKNKSEKRFEGVGVIKSNINTCLCQREIELKNTTPVIRLRFIKGVCRDCGKEGVIDVLELEK